jgi:hypothetical protein
MKNVTSPQLKVIVNIFFAVGKVETSPTSWKQNKSETGKVIRFSFWNKRKQKKAKKRLSV